MSNGNHDSGNRAQWLAGILFGVILSAISWLCGVVMRHEGSIGRWDGQLETIQRGLERLEHKVDDIKRKQ